MSENSNCLEGMACPICGKEDLVFVTTLVQFALMDDGTDFDHPDLPPESREIDFDEHDQATCPGCQFRGTVHHWRKENQVPPNDGATGQVPWKSIPSLFSTHWISSPRFPGKIKMIPWSVTGYRPMGIYYPGAEETPSKPQVISLEGIPSDTLFIVHIPPQQKGKEDDLDTP